MQLTAPNVESAIEPFILPVRSSEHDPQPRLRLAALHGAACVKLKLGGRS